MNISKRINGVLRLLSASLVLSVATLSIAGPVNRASHTVNINAGVLLVGSNSNSSGYELDTAPFAWAAVDKQPLIKPAGWNFINPYAPSVVTNFDLARGASIGFPNLPPAGAQIQKNNPFYWEVSLDSVSDAQLSAYNVLLLPVDAGFALTAPERAKLQRFMDGGGILWIDVDQTTMVDAANGAPISFALQTHTKSALSPIEDTFSPLLDYPYQLTSVPEFNYSVGSTVADLIQPNLSSAGLGALQPLLETVGPDFAKLTPVELSASTGNPLAMYTHVGDGAFVLTSRGTSLVLNSDYVAGAQGYSVLDYSPIKFAINLIYLSDGFSQAGQGSRKLNSTPIDIKAPLLQTSKVDSYTGSNPFAGPPAPFSPPVIYKGLVFLSAGNRLYAFSAHPGSDLDKNGNPDDGIQDFSLGKGYDLVWQSVPLPSPLSSPAAYTISNNGQTQDEVAVVDGSGNLDTFNAFPIVNGSFVTADNPVLKAYAPPTGAPNGYSYSTPPYAPTYFDGLIYVDDNVTTGGISPNSGRIWVVDPVTGNNVNNWCLGGPSQSLFPQVSGSPTIGYIPIFDNSGGQDLVAYLPLQPNATGTAAGIVSIWIGAKGEQHDLSVNSSNQLVVATRAGVAGATVYDPGGANPLGIRLSLIQSNGLPISGSQMATYFTGNVTQSNGTLLFDLQPGINLATLQSAGIVSDSIDYHIDWNNADPSSRNAIRGQISLPDDSNFSKQILGNIALGPTGLLYVVESNPTEGISDGSFFTLQEYGRGGFKVLSRFDLYPAFTLNLSGTATSQQFPATLGDNDPVQNFAPAFLGGPFSQLNFVSGPAVSGNLVYVKARGDKGPFNVPCTILMAFNANPPLANFTVPGSLSSVFTVVQPDISRTSYANKTQPDTYNEISSNSGQLTVTSTGTGTKIIFNNLAPAETGSLRPFSESLPLIIRESGKPDQVIEPDLTGNWSPLAWYTVIHGMNDASIPSTGFNFDTGAPIVTGDTVFLGGNSITPQILSGISPFIAKPSGTLFAMTAQISASDPFVFPDANRPWFKQVDLLAQTGPNSINANPDILWPQADGVTSFTQYRERLLQSTLGGADLINQRLLFGITAGDGFLFAYGNQGLYGYEHAKFTVADSNRVATFDPAGNALWSTDQIASSVIASTFGSSQSTSTIARVTRAYPLTSSSWLLVEPGANRIMEIDKSGTILNEVRNFTIDPNFVPDGFKAGEPLTLNDPQDAITYTDYVNAKENPFTNPSPVEEWIHFMIADTGNNRLVEVVDRYAVNPTTHAVESLIAANELLYHSPTPYSGTGFGYTGVSRVYSPYSGNYVYAATIAGETHSMSSLGFQPSVADPTSGTVSPQIHNAGTGNGSVLLIDGANTQVISSFVVPAIAGGVIRDPLTGAYNTTAVPSYTMALGNIRSATLSSYFNPATQVTEIRLMVTNQNGVYEAVQDSKTGNWDVVWMLPASAYESMRTNLITGAILPINAQGFFPTYAERTSEGTVIVVNGYVGSTFGGAPFGGEVLELEGNSATPGIPTGFSFASPNFGFNSLSIRFQLPSVQGARGIQSPVFADRK